MSLKKSSKNNERITEQKLKNKKFRKTEESIILAFISVREIFSVSRLIRLAGISRSTLYRHHKNIYAVVPDHERYILRQYRKSIKNLTKIKNIKPKQLYEGTLIFIFRHKKIIQFLIQNGSPNIIEEMLIILKPNILATKKVLEGEMFRIYIKTISAVIEEWGRKGFDKDQISSVVNNIIFLTNTAHSNLDRIVKHQEP